MAGNAWSLNVACKILRPLVVSVGLASEASLADWGRGGPGHCGMHAAWGCGGACGADLRPNCCHAHS
eukprot:11496982-Alexandrium_andersonii.AAC.1